jgi:ATP-binding protein involved in chromosome partitioning
LDADIYGPSVAIMAKTSSSPLVGNEKGEFLPVEAHGVHTVSLGNATAPTTALVWKGPLVGSVVAEVLQKAMWPKLDYLIVDTPPGTGDVIISMSQQFNIDGALVVTTPQKISVADVARNFDEFSNLKIPVIGLIENFSGFVCSGCGTKTDIWPGRGGEELSKRFKTPLLGKLRVDEMVSKCGDEGVPLIVKDSEGELAKIFQGIAEKIMSLMPIEKAAQK